ncbi:hypothetical protein CHR53_07155 [Neobacillus mesonae]|uniref:Uncharacterized protein n=2 Tax=Neobacillus mesonae TaxID=1193713 RepID=A0A3T0HVN6_9BACI|nr:hypothetical protein CHR53_07155 [Neobacillus mesonae]
MREIYSYQGEDYRMVERKAEVGELVLDLFDFKKPVKTIVTPPFDSEVVWYEFETEHRKDIAPLRLNEYRVLEPLESVDTSESSPQVIDMLANLARRVASLESQLRDTQGNVEKLGEEIAAVKYSATESAPPHKSGAQLLADAFAALAKHERGERQ